MSEHLLDLLIDVGSQGMNMIQDRKKRKSFSVPT